MNDHMDTWKPVGPAARRECPLCDWFMDEPPMETTAEWVGDAMVMRVRQSSALPVLAAHVLLAHPGSDLAGEVRAAADERGGIVQAVRDDLNRMVRESMEPRK